MFIPDCRGLCVVPARQSLRSTVSSEFYSDAVTTMTPDDGTAPTPHELAAQAAAAIRDRSGLPGVDLLLVLGSGWASGADQIGELLCRFDLGDLPGFRKPVVSGHGEEALLLRTPTGAIALVLTGRTHFYEGRGVAPTVHGVRTAAALGAKVVVLTNACGGLHAEWRPGQIVMIRDHINLTAESPIVGATFVDLTDAYAIRLRRLAHEVEPDLPEGVYVQFRGPHYETPTEVQMARIIGGDLVGMSTTLETIAAREAGMEVLGLSLVTNPAVGISATPLNHTEVLAEGRAAGPRLARLLAAITARLGKDGR